MATSLYIYEKCTIGHIISPKLLKLVAFVMPSGVLENRGKRAFISGEQGNKNNIGEQGS